MPQEIEQLLRACKLWKIIFSVCWGSERGIHCMYAFGVHGAALELRYSHIDHTQSIRSGERVRSKRRRRNESDLRTEFNRRSTASNNIFEKHQSIFIHFFAHNLFYVQRGSMNSIVQLRKSILRRTGKTIENINNPIICTAVTDRVSTNAEYHLTKQT